LKESQRDNAHYTWADAIWNVFKRDPSVYVADVPATSFGGIIFNRHLQSFFTIATAALGHLTLGSCLSY
jgi:hypothetical protein